MPLLCPGPAQGAARLALEIDGTETDAQLAAAGGLGAAVALLNVADGASRVHASRRVFEALKAAGSALPVVHHIRFPGGAVRDEIVINTGSMVRGGSPHRGGGLAAAGGGL